MNERKIIVYTDSNEAFEEIIELLRNSKGCKNEEVFWDVPLDPDL
jgi:hypothetical protein